MANFKNTKVYPIFILTVVVLVSVAVLMFINSLTKPVVAEHKREEINALLQNIYSNMDDYEYTDEIYKVLEGEEIIGYAFMAKGKGYGGEITIMVGLDKDLQIKDVTIMSHTETPGLGSRVTENSFTSQFEGLTAEDIALAKNDGKIDAVSGATISSEAVVSAVREEMKEKIKSIK
ncbi:MAG: RnfABCDGE type electron transport complex subunit G [Candidatus Humimicrobiaceae bacterium]